jgi:hypothetical protein
MMRKITAVALFTIVGGIGLALSSCSSKSSTVSPEASGATGGVTTGTHDDTCTADLQTDPHNCGVCGHDRLGGACAAGQCQPYKIASGLVVRGIALDHDDIYAAIGGADNDPGCAALPQIVRFSRTDYTMTAVAPCYQGARSPLVGFHLVGSYIFWEVNGDIMRSRTDGTETIDLGVTTQGDSFAVDSDYVYYTDYTDAAHPNGVLVRIDNDGQNRIVLSSDPPSTSGIAVNGINVYFRTGPQPEENDTAESKIAAMPRSGGAITYIAQDLPGIVTSTMVQSGGYIYWFDSPEDEEDTIDRVSTAGGQREVLTPGDAINLAFNSQYVFYAQGEVVLNTSTAGVWRVPLSGGTAVQVPGFTDTATVVAADDTSLVWESFGTPNVGSYTFGFYLLAL